MVKKAQRFYPIPYRNCVKEMQKGSTPLPFRYDLREERCRHRPPIVESHYCLLPFDELREDPDAEPEADAD